ncbi:hypothetical protein PIROE2DRAFT_19118, partial [Piromyces sp. E2]
KSSNNLKVKPLEQIENDGKVNSEKIPKNQVGKENNDNKKSEIEKKEVDKKKNRYHKKKSMSDLKKAETKSETLSDTKSDITSSTNEKPDLKKSASKQFLNQKRREKEKEDNSDIKLIESFLTSLSMKRDEMEREEEELINNPPPPPQHTANKFPKKQNYNSYTNKAYKPKKEIPVYDDEEIKRVLDCYDFPTAYKTHNLMEMFKEYEGNFRINWINDSRALFIFNTEENARSAYLSKKNETNYKIKPYENPTSEFSPLNVYKKIWEIMESRFWNMEYRNEIENSESENENENENINENENDNKEIIENNKINEKNDKQNNYTKFEKHDYSPNYSNNEKREYPSNHSKYEKRENQVKHISNNNQSKQQQILKQRSSTTLRQTSQELQDKPVRRQRPVTSGKFFLKKI